MEANRGSALELLDRARAAISKGDDAEAVRLVDKSLRLWRTEEGQALKQHLDRFGPGSAAATGALFGGPLSWTTVYGSPASKRHAAHAGSAARS